MRHPGKTGDAKLGLKSRDLPGLGDAAYANSASGRGIPTFTTVDAQRGQFNVQVTAPASLSAVRNLVGQLIS